MQAKNTQLQALLRQSFDVFNLYGKTPEQFKNTLFAFAKVLEPYDEATITKSFERWMKSQSAMPTPADIAKECAEIEACKPRPKGPQNIALPAPRARTVPWYGKPWSDLTENDKAALRKHCAGMGKKFEEYSKYLTTAMNYPTNFMGA